MGCQNDCNTRGAGNANASTGNCVKDTVKRILQAQREVAGDTGGFECRTSCDQSIDDLLSPTRRRPSRHTTIPFMLTCSDGCSTFFGTGFTGNSHRSRHHHFHCVESPVFKVRGFTRGSNNCVQLELLMPVYHKHSDSDINDVMEDDCDKSCKGSVCGYFGNKPIENFCYTGVCITVDLNCFCGITCLDPVTPVSYD